MMSRPRVGSFRIPEAVPREDTITYTREIDGEERTFISGHDVLSYMMKTLNLTKDGLEERISLAQIYGKDRDIHIKCRSPGSAKELLDNMPVMNIAGCRYVGTKASPDIYDHRPRYIRIYLHDVPITMKNEDLKVELQRYVVLNGDTKIYDDRYKDTNILNGSRYLHVREVYSKAGMPMTFKVKGFEIRTWHIGQIRDRNKHREIVWEEGRRAWIEKQQKERERQEEIRKECEAERAKEHAHAMRLVAESRKRREQQIQAESTRREEAAKNIQETATEPEKDWQTVGSNRRKNRGRDQKQPEKSTLRCKNQYSVLTSSDEEDKNVNSKLDNNISKQNSQNCGNNCTEKITDADDENESDDEVFEQSKNDKSDCENTVCDKSVVSECKKISSSVERKNGKDLSESETDVERSRIFITQSHGKNDVCTKLVDSDTLNEIERCYDMLQSNNVTGKSNSSSSIPESITVESRLDRNDSPKKCHSNSEISALTFDQSDENESQSQSIFTIKPSNGSVSRTPTLDEVILQRRMKRRSLDSAQIRKLTDNKPTSMIRKTVSVSRPEESKCNNVTELNKKCVKIVLGKRKGNVEKDMASQCKKIDQKLSPQQVYHDKCVDINRVDGMEGGVSQYNG